MKGRKKWIIGLSVLALALIILAIGPIMSRAEHPTHTVVSRQQNIEIRDYEPMIVAEVTVTGERKKAINEGFRILARFIFGDNMSQKKMAMTAPVTQQSSETIAMTAPVTQQANEKGWVIRFVMPSTYTLETLPRPTDDRISIQSIPKRRQAVIRFSGASSPENLDEHWEKLRAYLKENTLIPQGAPVYAFYNPPWTLPFLRRNEIMVAIPL